MTPAVATGLLADLLAPARPAGWEALRTAAETRLAGQELPDTSVEDWKYLDLAPLRDLTFRPAVAVSPAPASADVQPWVVVAVGVQGSWRAAATVSRMVWSSSMRCSISCAKVELTSWARTGRRNWLASV